MSIEDTPFGKDGHMRLRTTNSISTEGLHTSADVARLTPISPGQIRYWVKTGLVPPLKQTKSVLFFDFRGIVAFRSIKDLENQGMTPLRIRKTLIRLKQLMPGSTQPLSEVRAAVFGKRIIFTKDSQTFTGDGQGLLNFTQCAQSATVAPFCPGSQEDLFFDALEAEDEARWEDAITAYEAILAMDPRNADALANMGNIMRLLDLKATAERYYRKALGSVPDHPEANCSFADLLRARGESDAALLFYRKALTGDPDFSDAHYSVASLLHESGDSMTAQKHARRYLELEPQGEWADRAGELLVSSP
jgi:tetratricopeptide (TPR) repeat protein